MGKLMEQYLEKVKKCTDRQEAYSILFINYLTEGALKNPEIAEILLDKFPNLYLTAPRQLQDDIEFAKLAIKRNASDVLSFKNGKGSLEEILEFVKLNPFVPTYCVNLTQKEQDELFLEAFKFTDKKCFLEKITNDAFLEETYFKIYFKKLKTKNSEVLDDVNNFIKSFKNEEIEEIKELYKA